MPLRRAAGRDPRDRQGIQEEVLCTSVNKYAVRECLVAKFNSGPDGGLSMRLCGSGARWMPVRSRREQLHT